MEILTKGLVEHHLAPDMSKKFMKMMSSSNEMKHTGKDITIGEFYGDFRLPSHGRMALYHE